MKLVSTQLKEPHYLRKTRQRRRCLSGLTGHAEVHVIRHCDKRAGRLHGERCLCEDILSAVVNVRRLSQTHKLQSLVSCSCQLERTRLVSRTLTRKESCAGIPLIIYAATRIDSWAALPCAKDAVHPATLSQSSKCSS